MWENHLKNIIYLGCMASEIPMYTGIFFIILTVMGAAFFLHWNGLSIMNETVDAEREIMSGFLKTKLYVDSVVINDTLVQTDIYVINNGSVALDANTTDLYLDGVLISRNSVTRNVTNATDPDNLWLEGYTLRMTYADNLSAGTEVLVVAATGKSANATVS